MREGISSRRRRPGATFSMFIMGVLALAPMLAVPDDAAAQAGARVRVFLDCQTHSCPREEFRTEIDFVDWVRDRTASDLHVILTSQGTSAGTEYVFDLIGRNDFADHPLTATVNVPATATQDERLGALTGTFKAALAGYVARRGYAGRLTIMSREAAESAGTPLDPAGDPWNMWVFTVGGSARADGEERQREYELGARISANRTTPQWKIDIGLDGEYVYEEFELSEGTFINEVDEWELDGLAVRSLTPHVSAGGELEISKSTQTNQQLGGRAAAAVEWNYFPYEEANRRQLLVHYQLGFSHMRYIEETVLGETEESLFDQRVAAAWETREPWGDGALYARFSNYLHDWSKYRLSLGGDISIRLLPGLDLDLNGDYQLIQDQIYLSVEELDDEEIVAGGRQLPTGYEYGFQVGLSYRFGSIFNNVVNNRFPWIIRRF